MRIQVRKILSLQADGAACTLLILDQSLRILFDCGLNDALNIQPYLRPQISKELKQVNLALISNSAKEYSGAYPFLIEQLQLDPHLFYTTQPIMRYSPLNLHEQILNLRYPRYSKKVFNKIYSHYQEMSLIKPQQKKQIREANSSDGRKIIFVCYPAGGTIGSVAWRVSCGLLSVVYLAEHTNYALNHVGGLDLERLREQNVHVLLTTPCPVIQQDSLRPNHLLEHVRTIMSAFYEKIKLNAHKPKKFGEEEPKLLLLCYPNELLIQLMVMVRRVLDSLHDNSFEIVGVCHVSSRYLQLVKSQSVHFSNEFKAMANRINEEFKYERGLMYRINVATANAVDGLLNLSLHPNVQVHYIGTASPLTPRSFRIPQLFSDLNIFREDEPALTKVASLMELQYDEEEGVKEEEVKFQEELPSKRHALIGQYISSIGFPHFVRGHCFQEEEQEVSEYGLRYHGKVEEDGATQELLQNNLYEEPAVRNLSIEIMNTVFKLQDHVAVAKRSFNYKECMLQRTGFDSSVKIIKLLAPRDVVIVGGGVGTYPNQLSAKVYELQSRRSLFLKLENQLKQYRMNYLPDLRNRRIQKVEGVIQRSATGVTVFLRCVDEPQIFEFRMEQFYLKVKEISNCVFNGKGLIIDGILLQRNGNQLLLQGDYSPNYFKVRAMLYRFLEMS